MQFSTNFTYLFLLGCNSKDSFGERLISKQNCAVLTKLKTKAEKENWKIQMVGKCDGVQ